MNTDALLQANINLSKKIEELKKENSELFYFKERFLHAEKLIEDLKRRLEVKRSVYRIYQKKGDINYLMQVLSAEDTLEGMIIEVS